MEDACVADTVGLRSKFSRLISLKINDPSAAQKIMVQLRDKYTGKSGVKNFLSFRTVDGGDLYQYYILIGLTDLGEFAASADIAGDLAGIERSLKTNVITAISSELLAFRSDMSLIAHQ